MLHDGFGLSSTIEAWGTALEQFQTSIEIHNELFNFLTNEHVTLPLCTYPAQVK